MHQQEEGNFKSYLDWADRGRPALWRYMLTIALTFVLWLVLPILLVIPLGPLLQDPQIHLLLLPYSFLPGLLVAPLLAAWLLDRPGWTIALPQWPPKAMEYIAGVGIGFLVGTVLTVICLPFLSVTYNGTAPLADLGLSMVSVLILGLMVQTGFEELLFRGLLTQFVYHIFHLAIFAIVAQALVFGALHIGNVTAWHGNLVAAIPYVFAGLTFGWAAWRSGSLMMSAGLHFANNSFNTLVVSTKGDVLPPLGPLVTDMPTTQQGAILTGIQAVLTVLFVEAYIRSRQTDRVPFA